MTRTLDEVRRMADAHAVKFNSTVEDVRLEVHDRGARLLVTILDMNKTPRVITVTL